MAVETSTVVLNTGAKIPIVGLGTWKSKAGDVETSVKCALSNGYRHIDCAFAYGNEVEVGAGLAEKLADGTVKREDVFITSKLAPPLNPPDKVEDACKQSLSNLGVEYLDLYLMHWPVALKDGKPLDVSGTDICYTETWKAMECLVDKGYTKAIGVSNFNKAQLEKLLSMCKITPAANEVEVHPYLNNEKLASYCKSKGIVIIGHCPFASPDPGRPTRKETDPEPLKDPLINQIASKHNSTAGQVIIKWVCNRGLVTIPKSVTPARIKQNIEVKDLELSAEDMGKINSLNIPFRAAYGAPFVKSKYYPFNDEY